MSGLLVVFGLISAGYLLAVAIRRMNHPRRYLPSASSQERAAIARRRFETVIAARRKAARDMQLAIQQLSQSPDFRRAATFAANAERFDVPVEFRRRQFSRLRPLLIERLARRLEANAPLEIAANGLRELVVALGVAPYEADYIVAEAQGRSQPVKAPSPDYRERLRTLHAEHARRLEAIGDTPDLDDELREQLVEAEQERFRRDLLQEPGES